MSRKQILELTWTTDDTPPGRWPRVRLTFAEDPAREGSPVRSHEATLSVCGDPRCGCCNIHFQWLPGPPDAGTGAAEPPLPFLFDLNAKIIAPSKDLPVTPDSRRLAEIIRAELAEAEQSELRAWYLARKLHIIESTPGEHVDLSDLPDASDGLMIGFVEVFPGGLSLNFSLNGEAWVADEQYCVQPGCNCQEALLSFLKLREADGKLTTHFNDPPALYYNYITEATRRLACGPAGNPAVEDLLAAVKRVHVDLNTRLHLHHLLMQHLYLRQDIQQQQARRAALTGLSAAPRATGTVKIGRNEPCPCGSGLKYKRCCLKKAPEFRGNWEG